MADTKWYRGEGGVVWAFDQPLSETAAEQVRLNRLVEVAAPDDAQSGGHAEPAVVLPVTGTRPAQHDAKSAWVDFAVANGMTRMEADNATKAMLIEQFGDK